jgi:glycosyltransferase involved in cell wall biosynthesis
MPNVILEAIAARIPILTSNAGGIKEIAEGCALIIKEHDNVLEYCNHIISLLDRENIELKKNRTELAFQSLLKQHSWEKFVNSVKKEIEYV